MSQQQGVGSLADAFLSFSKSGSGTVYTVPTANEGAIPPVLPTTTLVKSIYISNESGGAVTTTVAAVDSSATVTTELYKDSMADGAQLQILDQPIVLEKADTLTLTGAGSCSVTATKATYAQYRQILLEQDDEFDWKLNPINSALKLLGVNKKDGMDEFDTIGLVRYRSNHDFNK